MANENNTGLAPEVAETNATVETPAIKKTRAPRQKKIATAAADVADELVTAAPAEPKKVGPGRGRKAKADVALQANDAVKATRKKRTPKVVVETVAAPATAADEMEDLIKLEEENKRLRKLLSEKLRGENADLRKRLGQA